MSAPHAAAGVSEVIERMDTTRLSQGEKIVGVTSGLLVLLSFFPLWAKYEFEADGFSDSQRYSAWSDAFNFLSKFAILLALTALVLVIVKAVGKKVELPVNSGLLYVGLAGLSTLLLLLLVITGPREIADIAGGDIDLLGLEQGFEVSRGIMLFVGLVLAAGATVGGYLHMQEEGTGTGPTAPPTAPPPAS
ncbi:MAG: hypothetical protein ACRDLB_13640 [Actinomycetota bacterium]